jgi:membrane associated rhomboid family serine protease
VRRATVIPLGDSIEAHRRAVITWLLIALNLAVFVWELGLPERALEDALWRFAVVPSDFMTWPTRHGNALDPDRFLPLFTSQFLHGGWAHLLGNVLFLWIFGDNVEDRLGRVGFLVFYLVAGAIAGLAHVLAQPTSVLPTVGASGAIAAVMGAYFVLYPHSRVTTLVPILIFPLILRIRAVVFLGIWFAIQLWSATAELGLSDLTSGVAWWAHAAGFATGALVGLAFRARGPTTGPPPRVLRGPSTGPRRR